MSDGNGALPEGWAEAFLFDVCRPKQWPTISTKNLSESGYPVYGANGKIGFHTEYTHEEPTILVTCRGATCGTINVCEPKSWVNGNAMALDDLATDAVEFDYALYALSNRGFDDVLSGSAQPQITRAGLAPISFPLAPLAEQRRIVSKIESLQERSSRARRALSEVGPLLEQFRQSVLRAAFSGRLTADWRAAHRDVEPATELLSRIRTERRHRWEQSELAKYEAKGKQPPKNWQDKYKEPEPVDESELGELPEGWCWVRLPELGYMNRGKSRHRPRNAEHLYGGPYPFVQTGDIAQSGGRIESHKQTYSEDGLAQSKLWPEGTVCITIAANIASSAVLTYPACFPDSVVGVIPDDVLCTSDFVEFFVRTAKEDLERFAPSTAQKNINLGTLTDLGVPLPPPEESAELVRLVREGLEIADRLSGVVAESESALTQLDQSILAKAFRGELVPQDPRDEPASELLKRIREARATAEAQKKTRKKTTRKKRPAMSESLSQRLTKWISETDEKTFDFERLCSEVTGDYDEIKTAVFTMLDEASLLEQVFDKKTEAVCFRRRGK